MICKGFNFNGFRSINKQVKDYVATWLYGIHVEYLFSSLRLTSAASLNFDTFHDQMPTFTLSELQLLVFDGYY